MLKDFVFFGLTHPSNERRKKISLPLKICTLVWGLSMTRFHSRFSDVDLFVKRVSMKTAFQDGRVQVLFSGRCTLPLDLQLARLMDSLKKRVVRCLFPKKLEKMISHIVQIALLTPAVCLLGASKHDGVFYWLKVRGWRCIAPNCLNKKVIKLWSVEKTLRKRSLKKKDGKQLFLCAILSRLHDVGGSFTFVWGLGARF